MVEATGTLREFQLDLADVGRSGPCAQKAPALMALINQTAQKDVRSWTVRLQTDRDDVDRMANELAGKDVNESPTSATCEAGIIEIRAMYFKMQANYKNAGQNAAIVLDRFNEMGEKLQPELNKVVVDPKDPSCQKFVAARAKIAPKYRETKEKISDLAKLYAARVSDTARALAGVPIGYCKVGDASVTTVTAGNVNTSTITSTSVPPPSETRPSGCRGLGRCEESAPPAKPAPASNCRGLGRCD